MSIGSALRIGLVTARFPVVSQLFIYELALALKKSGGDVEILPIDGADPVGVSDMGPLAASAALVRMPPPLDRPAAMIRALRRPREVRFDLRRPRRWVATVRQARLFEARTPFDIVHVQFATLGLEVLRHLDLGSLGTRALVVHVRGFDISGHVLENGRHVYDELFRRADLFIANCEYFRQAALALGCPPARCVVIGSPVDTDWFVPPETPRPPLRDRPLRIVAVGRLVEKKGFADAVDAVARLVADGRDATLDILGCGPDRMALVEQIIRRGLEGRVRLRGPANRAEVRAALHAADIGLAPSVTARTGDQDAPVNTLKEQMATGLPVVATRHGGIPELVVDGENGRLVPERDPDAIARAIAELAGDVARWPAMGAAGRRKVVDDHSIPVILEKTRAAYGRALDNSSTGKVRA